MAKFDIYRWVFQIPLDDIRVDSFDDNFKTTPCICCGKDVKNHVYSVHLLTNGNLVSTDTDLEESQGFFPIGNSCKNKLPNNFYFKQR